MQLLLMSRPLVSFFLFLLSIHTNAQPASKQNDTKIINLADPTIFSQRGIYYLYGTVEGSSNNGFLVYTSTNLKSWKLSKVNEGYALRKGEVFGTTGFWAPQVFRYNQKFYMAYVANEHIAIAASDSPLGPFKQATKQPLEAPVKQIDPFIYIDEDGRKYLYHVRLANGNKIFVAEMKDDFSAIKPESLRECIVASEDWENRAKAKWPVAEGPSVLKHKGLYYLFYTANDFRHPDYAVGYATSNSPLGPWKKYEGNPVVSKKLIGINGTGHGDFFYGKKNLFYVFHTHQSETKVGPRKSALVKARFKKRRGADDVLTIKKRSFYFLRST